MNWWIAALCYYVVALFAAAYAAECLHRVGGRTGGWIYLTGLWWPVMMPLMIAMRWAKG